MYSAELFIANLLVIAGLYAIFGLPARRYGKRIEQATARLNDTTVDASLQADFAALAHDVKRKTGRIYWISLASFFAVFYVLFDLYARSVESTAEMVTWVGAYIFLGGIAFIFFLYVLRTLVIRAVQTAKLHAFLEEQSELHPTSSVIAEARELVYPRISESGIPILSVLAVVAGVMVGSIYIIVLFISAQTAIECARSSKCL